ncbi:MAG: acylphosphatase [Steroidobacteraceae bacterium]|nr:acylphosphatase [Steroidobacteraceae bacterium]
MADSSRIPGAARRIRVRGRVQGVFFRASAAAMARALALRGRAQNLDDGSVLVLAAGPHAALAEFAAWLQHGPPMARVEAVEIEEIDPASLEWPPGFEVR